MIHLYPVVLISLLHHCSVGRQSEFSPTIRILSQCSEACNKIKKQSACYLCCCKLNQTSNHTSHVGVTIMCWTESPGEELYIKKLVFANWSMLCPYQTGPMDCRHWASCRQHDIEEAKWPLDCTQYMGGFILHPSSSDQRFRCTAFCGYCLHMSHHVGVQVSNQGGEVRSRFPHRSPAWESGAWATDPAECIPMWSSSSTSKTFGASA